MKNALLIRNCRLYNQPVNAGPVSILIEGKLIRAIGDQVPETTVPVVDAGGRIVTPGHIEVHIHGAGGSDMLDGTNEALQTISTTLAKTGTTGFLGTTFITPKDDSRHLRETRDCVGNDLGGARLLGYHLEGPYVNVKKKGGMTKDTIYPAEPGGLEKILEITGDALKMMTIAPELPGHLDMIRELVRNDVIAAFAHSDADYNETMRGFEAGITHVTHLYNAMRPLHHREPGPLAAIFENRDITAQIISDGHHVHPRMVDFAYRLLGPERCICITDGIQGLGLPDGRYFFNQSEYESRGGVARRLNGLLIGTTMSLREIAVNFMEFTGCSLETAFDSVTRLPAKLLGIDDRKGTLETGKDADLVLMDPDDFSVWATIIDGKPVFSQDSFTIRQEA